MPEVTDDEKIPADEAQAALRQRIKEARGDKWTAQYDFDKSDLNTKLFCAASDWMDRALAAEAALATAQRKLDDELRAADRVIEQYRKDFDAARAELAEARKHERKLREWRDRLFADPVMKAIMASLPDTGQP